MKKKYVVFYLVIIILINSIFVLRTSYFQGHDLDFHLSRIISIKDCIELRKMCYVAPNYLRGYGYGTPLFYPQLFLIFPALLLYIGLPLSVSYRIFIFAVNALSILSMYFCVKKVAEKNESALFSSLLYAFASYRVLDLTTRGALGEALSFIFFPFVIMGIYEIVYGDYRNYKYLILGMSGIMLSHLLSSVIMFLYLVIFCLLNIKRLFRDKRRIKYLIISAIVTFLLTCYFTIPMLEQLSSAKYNATLESTILSQRAMPIYHIFLESSFAQIIDGSKWIWSPGTIGMIFIILIILYFITLFCKKKYSRYINQNVLISLLFVAFTTKLFPWQIFQHLFYVIQFPWRLSIIPVTILSFIGGYVIERYHSYKKILILMIIMVGVISIQSNTVFKNTKFVDKDTYNNYDIMFGEYLPLSFNSQYFNNRGDIVSTNKNLDYVYKRKNNILFIDFKNNDRDTHLELPFIYYKGYSAYIDSNKLKVYENVNGLVTTVIDKKYDEGKMKVFYEGTLMQKITRYISIITLIGCLLFGIKKLKIKQ